MGQTIIYNQLPLILLDKYAESGGYTLRRRCCAWLLRPGHLNAAARPGVPPLRPALLLGEIDPL